MVDSLTARFLQAQALALLNQKAGGVVNMAALVAVDAANTGKDERVCQDETAIFGLGFVTLYCSSRVYVRFLSDRLWLLELMDSKLQLLAFPERLGCLCRGPNYSGAPNKDPYLLGNPNIQR